MTDHSSVIIVRENDSGGGCICCSGGMGEHGKKDPSYGHIRTLAEECGRLHREIRERFGEDEVEIIQIEPKDYIYVMPKVLKEIFTHGRPLIPSIKTLLLWESIPAVIVNGKTVSSGRVPAIEEVVKELGRD